MSLKFKQVYLTIGWTTIFLLSPLMPFGAISSSLAEEPPLSYPTFTRECTETEIRQYVEDSVSSEFARLALTACGALGKIGKEAKASVPNLMEALNDPDGQVRSSAAEALGEIGKEARAAVPMLIALLKKDGTSYSDVRRNAAVALGKIGEEPQEAVPVLIEALQEDDNVNDDATWAL